MDNILHESSDTEEEPKSYDTELLPPPDHPEVGRRVFEILAKILDDKDSQGVAKRCAYYYKLRRNKHWKDPGKPGLVTANLLHAHRTRVVNTLTDNNPTFNITRVGNTSEEMADKFDNVIPIIEHWWNETEQQSIFQSSVDNGETYGVTIEKSVFNPELEKELGEVETVLVDLLYFGLYPVECMEVQKAEAALHFYRMSIREARRKWKDKAGEILPDREVMKEIGDDRRTITGGRGGSGRTWFTTVSDTIYQMGGGENSDTTGEDDQCLIVECYVKDYSMVKVEEVNAIQEEGVEKEEITITHKPAYKGNIRCVTSCNMGQLVLSDRDNPSINPDLPEELAKMTYLWDKFPFSVTQSITDTSTLWSPGDNEQLEGLQMEVNKTLSQLTTFKNRAMKLVIKNPGTSGVPDESFTNKSTTIVKPKNAQESRAVDYMNPPPMPLEIRSMYDIYKDLFMLVSGDFELERAQSTGREVIAYKAIAAMLEHAATMQRGKIRNYSKMIRERGRMAFSLIQNWYDSERTFPFTNPETGKDEVKSIKGTDLILPIKLSVVSGSTMPVSKVQERDEAISLYKLPNSPIDDEELLKKLGWTDYRTVLKRKKMGPFGTFLQILGKIGVPPQILGLFSQLQQADPEKLQKSVEAGEVPTFQQMVSGMGPDEKEGPTEIEAAEAKMKLAQAENAQANAALTKEKIITERIIQMVKATGIKLDEEALKNERAKLVKEMEDSKAKFKMSKTMAFGRNKSPEQGAYRERGMQSNNDLGARE